MKVAITGATGFVGRHLARTLISNGHEVVLIARGIDRRDEEIRTISNSTFAPVGVGDEYALTRALAGCDSVAHCAGINREMGGQTYEAVHVSGTRNVVNAAKRANVKKIFLLSFLRARPDCGSAYHESKWASEEIVRSSGLDYTIVKSGLIYGKGDHMLDHLSHTIHTLPFFASVGMREKCVRPVAVQDVVRIIVASVTEGRLSRQTVAVTGPVEMKLSDAARQVARVIGKRIYVFPMPILFHRFLAWCFEKTMVIPLVSLAQVRMLAEGIVEPLPRCEQLPEDLEPRITFEEHQIRQGLPKAEPFEITDCRCLFQTTRH